MASVAIRSSQGWYMSAESGGGGKVSCDKQSIGKGERLSLLAYPTDDGRMRTYIRAANGQYLCAEGGGGGDVNANRDAANIWETFERVDVGGRVAFKTHNGHFLRASGGGGGTLVADVKELVDEAQFQLEPQPYTWKDLEISFTDSFREIWTDRGSGAHQDGGFWRPQPGSGLHLLGDLCVQGHGNPSGKKLLAVVRDLSGSALREPVEYRRVWGDWGSGADRDCAVWEPVPPSGYVAMGCVATAGYDAPPLNQVRCVRQDLVSRGLPSKDPVWTDRGSGADSDFSAWTTMVMTASEGEVLVAPGTFLGVEGYSAPEGHSCCYGLKLGIQEMPPRRRPTPLPKLDLVPGAMPLEFGHDTVHYTTFLPWFTVRDPVMSDAERLRDSPIYRLEREDRYHLHAIVDNRGNPTKQSETFKYTTGFSQEDTKNFAMGTSITIGFKATSTTGVKDVAGITKEFSFSLTQSFTYGWTWTDTRTSSETKTFTLNAEAEMLAAVYLVKSVVRLFRQDGSMVANPIEGTGPDKLVYYETK